MKFGSTISDLLMLIIFSPTSQSHTAFMLVTVERGDGVEMQDVRTEICKFFRVTHAMHTARWR